MSPSILIKGTQHNNANRALSTYAFGINSPSMMIKLTLSLITLSTISFSIMIQSMTTFSVGHLA